EKINLDKHLRNANIVFTGEGRTDKQTMLGKLPFYIASELKRINPDAKSILISGYVDYRIENLYNVFDSVHSITNGPITLSQSMKETNFLYKHKVKNIAKLLK